MHQKLPALRSVAAFPLWLLRIVARICFGLVSPMWQRIEALQNDQHSSDVPENVELRIDVARAIETLPQGCRDAVLLFYFCDLSVAETAGRLGITPAAARVRLHRGRELIRQHLGQPCGAAGPDER